MFSNNRLILIAPILLLISSISFKSFAQTARPDFDIDSSKTITLTEFDQRVDRAIILLKTKKLYQISDTDHVNIMMCWNTIFMSGVKKHKPQIIKLSDGKHEFYLFKQRFSGGRYKKLDKMIDKIEYTDSLRKIYPEWSPSRGMGVFFPKLQMAMYGTPEPYAVFNVTE
jgi:hypothetical protein